MKKKVVVSCGPIPARLDSVKFLTNRFKGGLAFETVRRLAEEEDMAVTIVKWTHTSLPWKADDIASIGISDVVNVNDVVEYAGWFEEYAAEYDAFVMAAAVANLMPSHPYETKFPSHLYKVGERFAIEFEIAPRAIDIVKKVNPRCCLIGYKLFDAATDEELVEIARHTLQDAKANVVFANKPSDAKSRKIAITADGAEISMNFEEHIEFMKKAIRAEYFQTVNAGPETVYIPYDEDGTDNNEAVSKLKEAKALVEYFEQTFPRFGTVAFRVPGIGMVTTSRGHKAGPVLVTSVDFDKRMVSVADGKKATLNAPLLWKMLEKNPDADYIVHRHFDDPVVQSGVYKEYYFEEMEYEFPGTIGEVRAYEDAEAKFNAEGIAINHHGYLLSMKMEEVDWSKYYEMFPERYFGTREEIEKVLRYAEEHPELETLEVGGNTTCRCKYNLDPNMSGDNVISYGDLEGRKFDVIVARNSIGYLSEEELRKVIASLKEDGVFVANGFANPPDVSIRCEEGRREVAVTRFDEEKNAKVVDHFLIVGDAVYTHSFYGRGEAEYKRFGFDVKKHEGSIIIKKRGI